MVSVCLPSDVLLQHLPSYLGFSYLGHGISLHGCSSKVQSLLLTLDEGYLLTAALLDLQRGIAPLGPPAPVQPLLLGHGVGPPGRCPWPRAWGSSSRLPPLTSDFGSSSRLFLCHRSLGLSATAPDLGCGVTPLGRHPSGMGSSWLLPLTSDVGWHLSAALGAPVAAACTLAHPSQPRGLECQVGSQETPGITGKFGLGIWNEAGQRLIEFCQENALVIANTLFQQNKRRLYT